MPVDAKGAVKAAMNYVREMYADDEISDLLLEEVEPSKTHGTWLVTVSFYRPKTEYATGTLGQILGGSPSKRSYKVLSVDKATGTIHSMKMRAKVTPDDADRG